MQLIVVGVDPGANTGIAWYVDGTLQKIESEASLQALFFHLHIGIGLVVFEDSRLQTTFLRQANARAMLKIARNVGEIDAYCKLIESECNRLSIKCIGISPKNKGAKLNSEDFMRLTGWTRKTNQHERDAAMVAYRFRNGAKL